jgi:hypothetical protein
MPSCRRTPSPCLGGRLWPPAIFVASESHLGVLRFGGTYYGEILPPIGWTGRLGDLALNSRAPGWPAGPVLRAKSHVLPMRPDRNARALVRWRECRPHPADSFHPAD